MDERLAATMKELEKALSKAHIRAGSGGTRAYSHKKKNVYLRKYRRRMGISRPHRRGFSVKHRVNMLRAKGVPAKEAYLQVREQGRQRELATCRLLQHLLRRAYDLFGDTEIPEPYATTIRRAEHRLTHPARSLTGLTEEHKRKLSEANRRSWAKRKGQ